MQEEEEDDTAANHYWPSLACRGSSARVDDLNVLLDGGAEAGEARRAAARGARTAPRPLAPPGPCVRRGCCRRLVAVGWWWCRPRRSTELASSQEMTKMKKPNPPPAAVLLTFEVRGVRPNK